MRLSPPKRTAPAVITTAIKVGDKKAVAAAESGRRSNTTYIKTKREFRLKRINVISIPKKVFSPPKKTAVYTVVIMKYAQINIKILGAAAFFFEPANMYFRMKTIMPTPFHTICNMFYYTFDKNVSQ